MSTQNTGGMTLSIRVHGDELAQLDAFVEELSEAAKGARISRSDAARIALLNGLKNIAGKKPAKKH